MSNNTISERDCLQIHSVLHSERENLMLEEQTIPIYKGFNNCRYLRYNGIQFIQQDPAKRSHYAARAKEGEKITWGCTTDGRSILIDNKGVSFRLSILYPIVRKYSNL